MDARLIREATLLGQSELAVEEPLVARDHEDRFIEDPPRLECLDHAADTPIDRAEHPKSVQDDVIRESALGRSGVTVVHRAR